MTMDSPADPQLCLPGGGKIMRNQVFASKLAILCGLLSGFIGMGLGVAPVSAEVVNIDVEGDPPNDTTYSGADGVLSGSGSVWNGVDAGVDAFGLQDESGSMTGYDVVFTSGNGIADGSSTNDLQDSGSSGSFSITGLSEGVEYDVAVYAFPFSLLGFTHHWARSRKGHWVVKRKTAKDRLKRAIRRVWVWCRDHRERAVAFELLPLGQARLAAMAQPSLAKCADGMGPLCPTAEALPASRTESSPLHLPSRSEAVDRGAGCIMLRVR
jgi:hypothetical protein